MGQTLSEPITEKQSSTCQDSRYLVGSSCMQGWRVSMDDSHTHILSLPDDPGTAFFAVYDGHGGANIAEYAGKHLHKYITNRPEYHLGNVEEALKQGFLDLDQAMLEEDLLQEKVAGSTAVVVLIKDNVLYCANVGDSRAIASVKGTVEVLSYDHKPNNEEELRRITAGGGWVQLNRVNGNLALSRALGDYVFKRNYRLTAQEQVVTAYPDVIVRPLNEDWEFIVIACDGIWEVLSNDEVISFCRARLLSGWQPAMVCEALMQRCLAPNCATGGLGCDNMTVLLICLLPFPRLDALLRVCTMVIRSCIPTSTGTDVDDGEEKITVPGGENIATTSHSLPFKIDENGKLNAAIKKGQVRVVYRTRTGVPIVQKRKPRSGKKKTEEQSQPDA